MVGNLGPGNPVVPLRPDRDGGEPPGGNMEARVARLEADMEYVKRDVADIKTDIRDVRDRLTTLEERAKHLVTHRWLALYVVGLAALIVREEIIALFAGVPN